jgi:hypothetical protein
MSLPPTRPSASGGARSLASFSRRGRHRIVIRTHPMILHARRSTVYGVDLAKHIFDVVLDAVSSQPSVQTTTPACPNLISFCSRIFRFSRDFRRVGARTFYGLHSGGASALISCVFCRMNFDSLLRKGGDVSFGKVSDRDNGNQESNPDPTSKFICFMVKNTRDRCGNPKNEPSMEHKNGV